MKRLILGLLAGGTIGGLGFLLTAQAQPPQTIKIEPKVTITAGATSAVGDGVADDTAALQQAIDSAQGSLDLPSGTFRLTKPLVIELTKTGPFAVTGSGGTRLVMDGPGPAIRIIGTHGGSADPKTIQPSMWEKQRTPLVDGLEIFGTHAEANGVELDGTFQPTLTRLTIRHVKHGVHIIKRNRNVLIADCHIYENRGIGIYLDDVNLHQTNIVGCHISYNGEGGVVVRKGEVRNVHIGTCDIESNMAIGGPPAASVLFDIAEGGSIREAAIVGCTIQHKHTAADSASVRLIGRAGDPAKVGNLSIANNVFSDVSVGIDLQHARGVTITGNTFMECYDSSIKAVGSLNLVCTANLIDRNPDYKDEESNNRFYFENCQDSLIDGCHFKAVNSAEGALVLKGCEWFSISDCMFLECASTRINEIDSSHIEVSTCVFRPRKDEPKGESVTVDKTAGK